MPRRRKNPADAWMPKRVYRGKSAYEYRPIDGGVIRLCNLQSSQAEVVGAYQAMLATGTAPVDLRALYEGYFKSIEYRQLMPRTQEDYIILAKKPLKAFGKLQPDELTPRMIRLYMDRRKAPVRANRERTVLMMVLRWGKERGLVKSNAAADVRPFRERPRKRYVTDAEMKAVMELAPEPVRVAMMISYLCGARQRDVLELCWSNVDEKLGVYIVQGKTEKQQRKLWTAALKRAFDRARCLPSNVATNFVVHNRNGQPYSSSGFRAMFRRSRNAALAAGTLKDSFTFHDLKHKAVTDYCGDKKRFSGHATDAMVRRYDHSIDEVHALDIAWDDDKN